MDSAEKYSAKGYGVSDDDDDNEEEVEASVGFCHSLLYVYNVFLLQLCVAKMKI